MLGLEGDVKGVLVGVWRVRTGVDVIEVVLGSCLRVFGMAKGRRNMNAMITRRVVEETGDEEDEKRREEGKQGRN